MLVGLAGRYAAGKDTVANYFIQRHGFGHYSLSDAIRDEAASRTPPIPPTRENLIMLGNELRAKYGPMVLVERTLQKLQPGRDYVISSVRNPGEVEALRRHGQFCLLEVRAPDDVRLHRILERNRPGDPKTLDELREKEAREMSSDPTQQQLHRCAAMADAAVWNERDEKPEPVMLYRRLDALFADIKAGRLQQEYR
jgi:dCMP deaminase